MVELWLQYGSVLLLAAGTWFWLYSKRYSHLPGELGTPIIGSLFNVIFTTFTGKIHRTLDRVECVLKKHGDVACMWFGPIISVLLADPDVIEELCTIPAAANKEYIVYGNINVLFNGAFSRSTSDSEWKVYRKRNNRSQTKAKLESYHSIFAKRSRELVEAIGKEKKGLDVRPRVVQTLCLMSLETHFGLFVNKDNIDPVEFYEGSTRLAEAMGRALSDPLYMPIAYFALKYHMKKADGMVNIVFKCFEDVMSKIKSGEYQTVSDTDLPEGVDLIHYNVANNTPFDRTLKEATEIMFVAMHTTAVLVSELLLFLALHPEVQEKAWREQDDIFKGSKRDITLEDLKQMQYLEMAIKETVRLVAGPLLPRRVTSEVQIGKYVIPRNATVILCSLKMRCDPKYWEKPNEFYPEHFQPEKVLERPKFCNLSFGLIPRNCPGSQYAINSSKVIVSSILREFKLHTPSNLKELKFHVAIMRELVDPHIISFESRETL